MSGEYARGTVARVRILELPYSADRAYDYRIPSELLGRVNVGSLVAVSLGPLRRTAIVTAIADTSEYDNLKPVTALADETFSLSGELLGLCAFLCERTFCSFGEAVQTVLPCGAAHLLSRSRRDPVERLYRVATDVSGLRLGAAEARAVEFIADGEKSAAELKSAANVSAATLKNMVAKGILSLRACAVFRNPYKGRGRVTDDNTLSACQTRAAETLSALAGSGQAKAALLYGVTGSGKTRVIKSVIDSVIASGRSVIVLVPEISLTGQTVDLFCGYFGERVAVIHSSLSEGEKLDAWRRIRAHEVDVVIGTRSAVFAPLDNLGMIVIDEEQEHTYKSDMTPKYHTRDVARYRAAKNNALMLLASATPSLESYYRAREGIYSLVTLDERYGDATLPEVEVSDLRADTMRGRITPIGAELREAIGENLKRGEQTILFVSRRGYNNFVSCLKCGEVVTCPNCSVSLTYHRNGDEGILKCHYCGYTQTVPEVCPKCESERMTRKGFGTQLVAEELHAIYPEARILRLDADAASAKFSHEAILSAFRSGEADVLIGTQMVTKGHNFPSVTLVGVINADAALYLDDFRATERTFALLTQVIGRAGRADKPGRALIQTYNPDNETINLACKQDYIGFYESAVKLRRQLQFPPFCEFVLLGVHGEDEPEVLELVLKLDRRLREYITGEYSDVPMYVFGPFEAPIYKVNNVYRMRIVIKCQVTKRMRELVARLLADFPKASVKAAISVDVNPASM